MAFEGSQSKIVYSPRISIIREGFYATGVLMMTSSAVDYSMIPPLAVLIATSNS